MSGRDDLARWLRWGAIGSPQWRRRPRTGALLVLLAAAAACTGGANEASPTTGAVEVEADADETGRQRVERLQATEPEVIDPEGALRCERLGYPCSWSDVSEDAFERSRQLSLELVELAGGPDPVAGLEEAVDRLEEVDDLVELIVDREAYTGLMFRLDGLPEMYALSSYAGPVGEAEELDLEALGAWIDAGGQGSPGGSAESTSTQPQGFASRGPLPREYHPTGGPVDPKTAVVIDPYAATPTECPEGLPQGSTCRITGEGRIEGSVIHNILNDHKQISSTYVPAPEDPTQPGGWDPILGPPLSAFDMVHLATHGSSGCADLGPGWVVTFSQDEPAQLPDRCYSVSAIGTYNKARYASLPAEERIIPSGLSLSGDKWVASDDFFVGKFKSQAIVYMSHCTSADGSLFASGRYGSYVGWHSYARLTTAGEAGVTFWTLMAKEGVEFDQAIDLLKERDLDTTIVVDPYNGGAVGAVLATGGRNQRARDIITVKDQDGNEVDKESVIKTIGAPEDGEPNLIEQLTFVVEGVKDGTEDDLRIRILIDDQALEPDLKLTEATPESGDGWQDWTLVEKSIRMKVDLTRQDVDESSPRPHKLEVRVSDDGFSTYSAMRADPVYFGGDLVATGPLQYFEQLESLIPPRGRLEDNELTIVFNTAGGEVNGDFRARVNVPDAGLDLGYWDIELQGTYDRDTNEMTGTALFDAQTTIPYPGFNSPTSSEGEFTGTVDVSAGTVTGFIESGDRTEPFTARIVFE